MKKAFSVSFLLHAGLFGLIVLGPFFSFYRMENTYVVDLVSILQPSTSIEPQAPQEENSLKTSNPSGITSPSLKTPGTSSPKETLSSTQYINQYIKNIKEKLSGMTASENAGSNPSGANENPVNTKLVFPHDVSNNATSGSLPPLSSGYPIPQEYLSQIKSLIQQNWKIPKGNIFSNSASISFRLWDNGTYSDIIIEMGSGNAGFDVSTVAAIKSVEKFPQFPGILKERYIDITITFNTKGVE